MRVSIATHVRAKLTECKSVALVRSSPARMRRTASAARIKDSASEFFTDLRDGVQTDDLSNKFDSECATLAPALSSDACANSLRER
jgi:hypothetical protein